MIKLFTHTDLDGVGCAILAKLAFGNNVDIEYCSHNKLDQRVEKHFNENTGSAVHITDICISDELAQKISASDRFYRVFDHHPTALPMSKYDWCTINIKNKDGITTSGTEVYYEWLLSCGLLYRSEVLERFIATVRDYDTWRWSTMGDDGLICKQINDLFNLYGQEKFTNWAMAQIVSGAFPHLYQEDALVLQIKQDEIDAYVAEKEEEMIVSELFGMPCGVVFIDKYVNEVCHKICEMHPEIDFVAAVNVGRQSVSYRSEKEGIDLGNCVAETFGGGGHPKAAGSRFNDKTRRDVINLILNK